MILKKLLFLIVAVAILNFPVCANAHPESEEIEQNVGCIDDKKNVDEEIPDYEGDPDEWFTESGDNEKDSERELTEEEKKLEREKRKHEKNAEKEKQRIKKNRDKLERQEKKRFIEIHHDDAFLYYLDRRTCRYMKIPHTEEQMINVWIKLLPNEPEENTADDFANKTSVKTSPGRDHYYLEHYFIRPKRQQIQFMNELEVTGRPVNDVTENRFSSARWENLIPGSIEDTIYHAVMRNTHLIKEESPDKKWTSVRDFIEDTVNISL